MVITYVGPIKVFVLSVLKRLNGVILLSILPICQSMNDLYLILFCARNSYCLKISDDVHQNA